KADPAEPACGRQVGDDTCIAYERTGGNLVWRSCDSGTASLFVRASSSGLLLTGDGHGQEWLCYQRAARSGYARLGCCAARNEFIGTHCRSLSRALAEAREPAFLPAPIAPGNDAGARRNFLGPHHAARGSLSDRTRGRIANAGGHRAAPASIRNFSPSY